MRIGFVSTYPPIECGIATYTRDLESALRMQSHETFVLSAPGAKGDHVHIAFAPDQAGFAEKAFGIACNQTPDVIHVQHEFGLYGPQRGVEIIGFLTRCRIAGIPTVTTLHTVNADFPATEREIVRRILAESDRVIVHEPQQRETLETLFPESCGRIHVIPHGVRNVAPILRAKRQLGLDGSKVVLLCGYFRPTKGFHRALSFMPEVFRQVPGTLLVVAGKTRNAALDNYRAGLMQQFADSEHADRIRIFHGQFPQYTFDSILSAADVVAMPYERGAQSGIMAQCMAMETPMVASDLPAFENALLESGAGLVAKDDPGFSRQIIRLLTDRKLYSATVGNIRAYKQSHAWEKIAQRHEEIYRSLLPPEAAQNYVYLPEPFSEPLGDTAPQDPGNSPFGQSNRKPGQRRNLYAS